MPIKQALAIGMLTTAAAFAVTAAHAAEPAKDPKTGKKCVIFISSDFTNIGQARMIYRNICATAFQISVQTSDRTREGSIAAGTPEKPTIGYVTCKPDERCESAKWKYE